MTNFNNMSVVHDLVDEFEYLTKENRNLSYLLMVGQLREMSEVYGIGFQFTQWFLKTKDN